MPLPPDLGGSEHATGAAHVTEGSLTGTVGSATGHTGNTGNSATSTFVTVSLVSQFFLFWNAHPTTRQRSGDRPSRTQRTAGACSCSCQCEQPGRYPGGWGPGAKLAIAYGAKSRTVASQSARRGIKHCKETLTSNGPSAFEFAHVRLPPNLHPRIMRH